MSWLTWSALWATIHLDVRASTTHGPMLDSMDTPPRTTALTALAPRPASHSVAVPSLTPFDQQERQLIRLQHWRASMEADGYQTMLSVVPPCGLIVRDKQVADRWLALSPDRSLAVFQRDGAGNVRCQHLLVEALGLDSDAASALVASATVRRYLQRERL
jgi:hypothetical protein